MPRRDEDDDYDDRPRRRRRDDFDDDDDYDRPRRRRKPPAGPPIKLILAIVGGVGLLCVLGCFGLIWSVKQTQDAVEQRQVAEDKTSGELTAARAKHTVRNGTPASGTRPPRPPANLFRLVKYDAPNGPTSAYVTPDAGDGQKRPAVVWITGGDCNSIDEGCWNEGTPDNDQSAAAFRKAGLVMMFPSLRGGNDNPGLKEGYYGEVDDVIAAAAWLGKQPHVDPARIYLGGHSTGGTLVMLVAECTDKFRAVFSFGPVDDVSGYPAEYRPMETDAESIRLRCPGRWLHCIKVPTFVFEGTAGGNSGELRRMARLSTNPKAKFYPVRGADHFNLLAPLTRLLAEKVKADAGPTCAIALTEDEVNQAARRR